MTLALPTMFVLRKESVVGRLRILAKNVILSIFVIFVGKVKEKKETIRKLIAGRRKSLSSISPPLRRDQAVALLPVPMDCSQDIVPQYCKYVQNNFTSRPPPDIKVSSLKKTYFVLPNGTVFIDKYLPTYFETFRNENFSPEYFVNLHHNVSAPGPKYSANTPNYIGAKLQLSHSKLNILAWQQMLNDDEKNVELLPLLKYGFPLGLTNGYQLSTSVKNHSSSYMYYKHVDKFVDNEVHNCGMVSPFLSSPFSEVIVSPLMMAPKKPNSHRTVFDATFGEFSINNNTQRDSYMGILTEYDFPSVDSFEAMVVAQGKGALMWKRDLSRYYLQLPLDPVDYDKTAIVWHQQLFFFCSLMFGLRHSGLAGQRVTSAVTCAHNKSGLTIGSHSSFNSCNYSDDLGGVEAGMRAWISFYMMGALLKKLGLEESVKKGCPPSTNMVYLGVLFDTISQTKSVPPEKLAELLDLLEKWTRKSKASKKDLQSLVGKLILVAKVVRHSRVFVCRLLSELQRLHHTPQATKVLLSEEVRKDILWWKTFIRKFNGSNFMTLAIPDNIDLEYAGDSSLIGGGAYFNEYYWSRLLPSSLVGSPIHVLEFWVLLASIALWGHLWTGKNVLLYCDNDACCDVMVCGRPKDKQMVELFREYTYRVCLYKFNPVIKKISSKENKIADFLSRNHVVEDITTFFQDSGIEVKKQVQATNEMFIFSAPW